MKNQKGFVLPILIIASLLILAVVAYFFSPKSISLALPTQLPTVSTLPPTEVAKPKPSVFVANRIIFAGESNLVIDLPTDFRVLSTINNSYEVEYNNSVFRFNANIGGGGGPCSM